MSRGPTERFFIDACGPDYDAVRRGLTWLVKYANRGGFSWGGLFVSDLTQVDDLGNVLGDRATKKLRLKNQMRVNGVSVELLTPSRPRYFFSAGPILGVWVDSQQLHLLDYLGAPAICAIPWAEVNDWKATWNPVNIATGEATALSSEIVTNPVVVEALKSLTGHVNLTTGLSHPNDKAAAVQMFEALRRASEVYDPVQLRAWAAKNGWSSRHALDLQVLGQEILAGRTVRTQGGPIWRDDVVDAWRRKAATAGR